VSCCIKQTVAVVAGLEGAAPLIIKPAIGHDPEPIPSTLQCHNQCPGGSS